MVVLRRLCHAGNGAFEQRRRQTRKYAGGVGWTQSTQRQLYALLKDC